MNSSSSPFSGAPKGRRLDMGPDLMPFYTIWRPVPPLALRHAGLILPTLLLPNLKLRSSGLGEATSWALTGAPGPARTGWAPV